MPTVFEEKKKRIIKQLEVPETEYTDLSPKGSIDAGIRELIDEINAVPSLVTTSSCGGRVSVYVEGRSLLASSEDDTDDATMKSSGGKGGGRWLFVSHDPVGTNDSLSHHFGFQRSVKQIPVDLSPDASLVHFKFEAMVRQSGIVILHRANKEADFASYDGIS
jgi:tRNA wybutosine-synthesizing protein 3